MRSHQHQHQYQPSACHEIETPLPIALLAPMPPLQPHGGDRGAELPQMGCNLASLCEHIQAEGFGSGAFSDVAVEAMGSTYSLHRLILSRSAYFRLAISSILFRIAMLQRNWAVNFVDCGLNLVLVSTSRWK
jgi:hypothetical protein